MATSPLSFGHQRSSTAPEAITSFDMSYSTSLVITTPLESVSTYELARRLSMLEEKIDSLYELINNRPEVYTTKILDLDEPRFHLRFPIAVVVESYLDEVVATVPEFNLYASGVSDAVALAKLKLEISSTYGRLVELGSDQLGPLLRGSLAAMNQIIEMNHG